MHVLHATMCSAELRVNMKLYVMEQDTEITDARSLQSRQILILTTCPIISKVRVFPIHDYGSAYGLTVHRNGIVKVEILFKRRNIGIKLKGNKIIKEPSPNMSPSN